MSSNVPVSLSTSNITAPTPQNTPLASAPIQQGLSRPTVPDITEDVESDGGEEDEEGEDGVLGKGAVQNVMLKLVQGRLATLVGKSSGYIESLPVEQKRTLEALKGVQGEYEKIQIEFKNEMLELEKKYLEKYKPIFQRRSDLINGKSTPTSLEIAAGEAISTKDDEDYTPLPANVTEKLAATSIPEFWLTALRNHLGINELITDRDAGALKHLVDIIVSYDLPASAGQKGFMLSFVFATNEYFENETLTKTYLYKDEVGYGGDFIYDRAIGTAIKWKEDKDLTKEIEIKKQRNKNTNRTRVIRKSRPTDSFFNFFSPPVPPKEEEEEEMDEEEMEDLDERLELDYQIGEDLKERIIPRAVDYFTGKALEYDSLDELDSDEDDDDDDEDRFEDEDSEDGSDDSNNLPPPHRGAGVRRGPSKRGAAGGGNANVDPEECKQQ